MVSCSYAVGLRLALLLHFGPQQEPSLKTEVKQLTGGKSQRFFCHESFESGLPPLKHCSSHCRRRVSRTPEDLRSKNLKATEVQSAVLKETKYKRGAH